MKLTILGCAGSYASPTSPASGYLLQAPYHGSEFNLVVDLGNGTFGPLQRHVGPGELDAVALSHLHADHCIDMCSLYVVQRHHPHGPMPRIPVFGPAHTAVRLARGYDLPEEPGMRGEFDFRVWGEGEARIGPFTMTVTRVIHPVEAYAIRVEADGRVLTYSGDTAPTDALVELARGSDIFLCEASYVASARNPPGIHLTGADAGDHARRAGVGRLLLTHIPAWTDADAVLAEAKGTYDGQVDLVAPGDSYAV